jgi:hypothetical protein
MPYALNTLTGIVDFQPEHIVDHPVIGRYLKEVPEGTKSLVPGMFKPGTVDEFEELNTTQSNPAKPEGDEGKDASNKTEVSNV